jgi:hypothetical protein
MFWTIIVALAVVGVVAIFLTFAVESILLGIAFLAAYLLVEQVREFVHFAVLLFSGS